MSEITAPKTWNSSQHYLEALNSDWYKSLFKIQDCLQFNTCRFFRDRNLRHISLPITTNSISSPMGIGSDSLPVKVNLFGVDTFLADSMQFMLEYGCRYNLTGCYYLMPSFRGDSDDPTHLSQFYHAEAEVHGSLEDVMTLVEHYLKFICSSLLDECASEISAIAGSLSHVENFVKDDSPISTISFDEAVNVLASEPENFNYIEVEEQLLRTLSRTGEQNLMKMFHGFVWVTEFDHLLVPFYQAFSENAGKSRSADLLFGIGEVVGAGERHTNGNLVREALKLHQTDVDSYDWYCTLKDVFPMKTSGFGMGTERFYCWLLNHHDVRDCQLLPRFNGVLTIP